MIYEVICFENESFSVLLTCFSDLIRVTLCRIPSISNENTLNTLLSLCEIYDMIYVCCFSSLMIIAFCIVLAHGNFKTVLCGSQPMNDVHN